MKFNKKKLKSGLTVLHEKRDVPVTTVMLATKFGSAYETKEEKGIAHFIEHLCFKGTKKRTTRQIAFELEKVGGNLNAFTSEEATAYHVKLPSEHLELATDVIFDIFFNPIFPEQEIKKEASVICEEIKMYNDDPMRHAINKIKECLYKEPFGMFSAGIPENIKKMTREQLIEIHEQIYCPENAILCVVGNNDFSEVVKFAEKFCVDRKFSEKKMPKIESMIKKEEEKRPNLQQANLVLGFHFPSAKEKQRYVSEVFSVILGQGMSSKLFTEVREKRGLVYGVKTFLEEGEDYGYLIIWAGTDNKNSKKVIDICLKEFGKMKSLTEQELEDGKKQVIGNYHVGTESSENTALGLIFEEVFGKAEDYYNFEKNIKKVGLKDIQKLASKTEYSSFVLGGE